MRRGWLSWLIWRGAFVCGLFFTALLCLSASLSASTGQSPRTACPTCAPPRPCQRRGGDELGDSDEAPSGNASARHLLCLIVPFRDRFEELQIFAPHMDKFLRQQGLAFHILILNQLDTYRFNRAALINAGYEECVRLKADYLGMQDVDLLPLNPGLSYEFPLPGTVRHVASPDYHPRYNYTNFIGGILLLRLEDYKAVDGMSNRYWGWGLEDDEFFLRLKEASLNISRPTGLNSTRTNTFMHIHDQRLRPRDSARCGQQRKVSRRRDRSTGLQSLRYQLLSRTNLRLDGTKVRVLNVQLHCDLSLSPWCQRSSCSQPS